MNHIALIANTQLIRRMIKFLYIIIHNFNVMAMKRKFIVYATWILATEEEFLTDITAFVLTAITICFKDFSTSFRFLTFSF